MHYRTIIISDIHLGSPDAKHEQVTHFLNNNTCDHLILNGDIIDGRYLRIFPQRPKNQTKLLDLFKKIAQSKTTKVTYIYGNHDGFLKDILPLTINEITVEEQIILESGSKKYIVCHGQQFDHKDAKTWIEQIGFIGGIFLFRLNRVYNKRRAKHGKPYYSIVKNIKQLAKKCMTGNKTTLERRILEIIIKNKTDGCICGHLHRPEISTINGFDYLNSGDRVESYSALVENEKNERALVYRNKK